jgi:hypothetical protein
MKTIFRASITSDAVTSMFGPLLPLEGNEVEPPMAGNQP